MDNMEKESAFPTRGHYMSVCGGLPPNRDEQGNLSPRENFEIKIVLEALGKSDWYNTKFKGIWSMFPLSDDGVLTVDKSKDEVYTSPDLLLSHIVEGIWKSIGIPLIRVEEDKSLSFYVPSGTWPYVAEEREKGTIVVEDRVIDIEHVCDLVDDELCNIMTWFWNTPAFAAVKMMRDFIGHVDKFGFDDAVTDKLKCIRKMVHPWADKVWEASSVIGQYPYDRLNVNEDKEA